MWCVNIATDMNLLIASGVNPKEAQTLARHATAELSIGLYGCATDERLAQAIDAMAQHVMCMAAGEEDQAQLVTIPEDSGMPTGGFDCPLLTPTPSTAAIHRPPSPIHFNYPSNLKIL